MICEQIVDALSETETANTSEGGCKGKKSKSVIQTMENGGHIS